MRLASPRLRLWLCLVGMALVLGGCATSPFKAGPQRPTERLAVDAGQARRLISAYRQAHGRDGVSLDPVLVEVAQRQADAMASANDLSHTVDGHLPQRLARVGADRPAAVENVSAGYASLAAALGGWRRSPSHDANLLFGPMRRMGIAAASAPGTRYRTFWALVMTD